MDGWMDGWGVTVGAKLTGSAGFPLITLIANSGLSAKGGVYTCKPEFARQSALVHLLVHADLSLYRDKERGVYEYVYEDGERK